MIAVRPLQKLNLSDEYGSHPHALLHLLCGQSLAPSRLVGFLQIHEGTLRDHQRTQLLEHPSARRGHEAVPSSRHVDKVVASVVAHDDGIQAVWPWSEAADQKLLTEISPMFEFAPYSTSCGFKAILTPLTNTTL
jgi:hypothetical protein